jgi:hypothetical protein
MRRSPRASLLVVATLLLGTACSRNAMQLNVAQRPADPALLLSCARSVASHRGLGEIAESGEQLQAKSPVVTDVDQGATPTYDVLTVKFSRARKGLNMLVGSTSFVLRQLRTGGVGTAAARSEWVGTTPSARAVQVRDAVLQQCGSLGH